MTTQLRIIILCSLVIGGFIGGWLTNGWRLGKVVSELHLQAAAAAETNRLAAQSRMRQVEQLHAQLARQRRTTDKRIEHHVEKLPDNVMLSGALRVLHDAAASGKVPEHTAEVDAAPVAVRTLARTLAANYSACRENAATLEELQAVVAASGVFGSQDTHPSSAPEATPAPSPPAMRPPE